MTRTTTTEHRSEAKMDSIALSSVAASALIRMLKGRLSRPADAVTRKRDDLYDLVVQEGQANAELLRELRDLEENNNAVEEHQLRRIQAILEDLTETDPEFAARLARALGSAGATETDSSAINVGNVQIAGNIYQTGVTVARSERIWDSTPPK
jgi:uncharacterized protein YlxW (UPF0749 family)